MLNLRSEARDTGYSLRDFTGVGIPGQSQPPRSRLIVRCIAKLGDQVLLCKRAEDPRRGCWNTPGGFVDIGETLHSATAREVTEESGAVVGKLRPAFIHRYTALDEYVVTFLAEIESRTDLWDSESADVRLFCPRTVPWKQLAFPSDGDALRTHMSLDSERHNLARVADLLLDSDGRILVRSLGDAVVGALASLSHAQIRDTVRAIFKQREVPLCTG